MSEKSTTFVRTVLVEKRPSYVKIIRVIEFDGMGGREYVYHCGNCRKFILSRDDNNSCRHCLSEFSGEVEKVDSWGLL